MRVRKYPLQIVGILLFVAVMVSIPWEKIYGSAFRDKQVYFDYFLYGTSILEFRDFNAVLDYVVHEFLWHSLISMLVGELGISIEIVFLAISALTLAVFSYLLVTRHGIASLILLVNPLVIDLVFSQFRSSLAISLLGLAYLLKGRTLAYLFIGLSIFIHTAALLFIFMYISVIFAQKFFSGKRSITTVEFSVLCCIGFTVSLLIGPLRETILSAIGDRRAEYTDASSTFLYSSFWIFLLLAIGMRTKTCLQNDIQRYSVVILSLVTMNTFVGAYSTRFLAASFPMLMSTILSIRGNYYRLFILSTFCVYMAAQWLFWLSIL